MSLLTDLQSIDLSSILDARGSITASVNSPELQEILKGGAAQTALASLGSSLGDLQADFSSPEDLLRPLSEAFSQLGGSIQVGDLPIEALRQAVEQGAEIVRSLVEGLDQDPLAIGRLFNLRTEGMSTLIQDTLQTYTRVGAGEISVFKQLIDLVERGVPSDPAIFANLAVDALMPFPSASLREVRLGVDGILNGAALIQLPVTRTAGLLLALDGVEKAALTGNVQALQSALAELERVRQHTLRSIQDDLRAYLTQVDGLRLDGLLSPIVQVSQALGFAQESVLEFMQMIRDQVQAARAVVEELDTSQVGELIDKLFVWLEATAQAYIVDPIETAIENLKAWLRSLLHEIPLFELRAELSDWMRDLAQTIRDADLDGPAEAVRQVLIDLGDKLSPQNLTAEIQAALGAAGQAIQDALDGVLQALEQIASAINGVAGEAQAVLEQAAQAIAQFKVLLDDLTVSVQNLGIEEAGQQVADEIRKVREAAEALLSVQPLPESMRPLIEQLIDTLESVDFDAVMQPVEEAVAQFRIPPDVSESITLGLQAAGDALENLIPDQLIQSIEAEINEALETLRGFDPSSLLPDVSGFLESAAVFVEGLDPAEHLQVLEEPFQAILHAFDLANPQRLLQPVIQAYDELLGNVTLPTPDLGVERFNQAIGSAGERLAQAATTPLTNLSPPEATLVPPGGTPGGGVVGNTPPPAETIRAGDIIRLFGYLPMKLREALAAMNQSQAGEVLRAIDSLTGGLANDLRRLQGVLWELEDRLNAGLDGLLAPLAPAQLRAQLAIQANFQAGAINIDASLGAVALAGPGTMRQELAESMRQTVSGTRQVASAAGGSTGAALERIAVALESCSLARLVSDLDALLAALDPEPIAAEIDAFVLAVLRRAPGLLAEVQEELAQAVQRAQAMIAEYNPLVQAQKFIRVLDVLREELERLSPRSLAAELGELHTALREALLAYDPAVFTGELTALIASLADSLRALNPSNLLGDLSFLDGILDQIEAASPAQALAGVGESLQEVGAELATLDPGTMLQAVTDLGPQLLEAFTKMLDTIRDEIVALLQALKYAATSASASVSVSVGAG